MKVQSFKTMMILCVCSWGVTGAVAFWAGNRFGPNGSMLASASKDSKGNSQEALQKALEKALSSHSGSAKDPGAPTVDQLLALKGKADPALIARWAASLSPADCAREMADLQKMPAGTKRDAMLGALYESWAKQDPQGFLTNSSKMTNPLARQASTAKALSAWAAQDPKSALAWLDKNPAATGALQTQQYNAVIAGYAANNPTEAYAYVMALPDGATPNSAQALAKIDAMRAVISGMADKGSFSDIVNLVGQMPANSQIQTQAYRELVNQWVANSPTDAAQWITSLDPTQFPQARQYSNQLVQTWAQTDPMAAAAWAADQDAQRLAAAGQTGGRGGRGGNLLATAVGQMVSVGDVDVAGNYLNTLQAGPEKDSAVTAFITGAASEDPAGAMNWIPTISNPNMQNRMMTVVGATWSQSNPDEWNKYLATLDPVTANRLVIQVQQITQPNNGGGFAGGNNGQNGGGRNGGGRNGGGNVGGGFQPAGGNANNPGAATGAASGPTIITGNGGNGRRNGRNGGGGGG